MTTVVDDVVPDDPAPAATEDVPATVMSDVAVLLEHPAQDVAWRVADAAHRSTDVRDAEPRHVESIDAAPLGDERMTFLRSDLHVIAQDNGGDAAVEPISIGPCAE